MIYCISDIHGEYDRYLAMLKLIRFSREDTLYILGDCADRRSDGIDVLLDAMRRPNVHLLLGNHEKMMLDSMTNRKDNLLKTHWLRNGGGKTRRDLIYRRTREERRSILQFIRGLPDHLDIEVNGKHYHLVHGYPADNQYDRIWGRPDPAAPAPLPGRTVIVGHTCTCFLNSFSYIPFQIWHGDGIIGIDCGCGHDTPFRRLACLRLDDGKEFYT